MTDQLAADGLDDETAARPDLVDDGPPVGARPPAKATTEQPEEIASRPLNRFGRPKRASRWDRPPEPHDWRFFVGTVGNVLITTGLLLFGFVGYQLWGTGIETARAQNKLENEFEQLVATVTSGEQPDRGMLVAEVPVDDEGEPTPGTVDSEPGDGVVAEPVGEPLPQITADDITVPVAVDLSEQAVVQENILQPFRGDPLLRLEIPKIGRDDMVVPGVTLNDLKKGPGHYPDTPLPGQLGNAAIAGHRTTYGAPFFDVDQLSAGDEIIATLLNGDRFVYEVTFVEIVTAADYQVVTTADPNIAELTLTSCDPKYTARDRIVVHSVLNPDKSSNVGFPTFYTLEPEPDPEPIPGDDPTLTAEPADGGSEGSDGAAVDPDDIPVTETESGRVELDPDEEGAAAEAGDGDGDEGATASDDTAADQADAADQGDAADQDAASRAVVTDRDPVDAFSQGWFDDRAAFPQIALWAAALIAISILAYRISRRFRNLAVGIALGTAPFLVALYFFYQNVNRLLPPGI